MPPTSSQAWLVPTAEANYIADLVCSYQRRSCDDYAFFKNSDFSS